jgi:hypothetical protein
VNTHLSGIAKGVNTKQFVSAIGQSESFVRAARGKAASAFPDNGPWATSLLTMNMAPDVTRAKIGEIEIVSSLFAIHIITLMLILKKSRDLGRSSVGLWSEILQNPQKSGDTVLVAWMNLSRDDFYYLVYRVRYHEILELALQKYPVLRNTTEATAHTEFERNIVKFLGYVRS